MKIGILSDIHDHLDHLSPALAWLAASEVETLLCCGDLCAPFIMARLGQDFSGEIHLVFGNNDADLFRITRIAQGFGERVHLHGELAEITMADRRIGMNHFDYIARPLAASGQYDLVCFGHNHQCEWTRVSHAQGTTHLLNPGTLMGYTFGGGVPQKVPPTFCTVDLKTMQTEFYEIAHQDPSQPDRGPQVRPIA